MNWNPSLNWHKLLPVYDWVLLVKLGQPGFHVPAFIANGPARASWLAANNYHAIPCKCCVVKEQFKPTKWTDKT